MSLLRRLHLPLRSGARTWPPPDPASSAFHEATPMAALRRHVRAVRWGHEDVATPVEERILPDGVVHLIVVLPDDPSTAPHAVVLGATLEATVVHLAGKIRHVGFELEAGGASALLGVPAGTLEGQAVPLEDLWGERANAMCDALRVAGEHGQAIADVGQRWLAARGASGAPGAPPLIAEALTRMQDGRGRLRVGELARDLGVSDRRLEQLFHQHVGVSPKAACRLARFQRVVERLGGASRARRTSWAEVALDAGFSDQSHLANDVRAISGLSPTALLAASGLPRL